MARPTRIEFPGAHYHIFSRGDRKDNIFRYSIDYEKFLEKLKIAIEKFNVDCVAYALMKNHYHLYIITNEPNLTQFMHYINSSYTNWYKRKYGIVGHIFQGRYKAILIDSDNYMDHLVDYIHLNPIKSGLKKIPWEYKWSSCSIYCGNDDKYKIVNTNPFFEKSNYTFQDYKVNISNSNKFKLPHRDLYKSLALGDEGFKKFVESKLSVKARDYDEPSTKMNLFREPNKLLSWYLDYFNLQKSDLFSNKRNNFYKKLFIWILKRKTRLKNKDISEMFDIKPGAISYSVNQIEKILKKKSERYTEIEKMLFVICRPDPAPSV